MHAFLRLSQNSPCMLYCHVCDIAVPWQMQAAHLQRPNDHDACVGGSSECGVPAKADHQGQERGPERRCKERS